MITRFRFPFPVPLSQVKQLRAAAQSNFFAPFRLPQPWGRNSRNIPVV